MSHPDDVAVELRRLREQLASEHKDNRSELAQLRKEVSDLRRAFPGDDPDGHRRYHESLIEWRELRNNMIRAALIQAAKVGGLGAIGWVAYALWTAFKMELRK